MGADSSIIQHTWLKIQAGVGLACLLTVQGQRGHEGQPGVLCLGLPAGNPGATRATRPPVNSGGQEGSLKVNEQHAGQQQPAAPCLCPHQRTGRLESCSSSGAHRDTGPGRPQEGDSVAMPTKRWH